jgi:hypothetical protein
MSIFLYKKMHEKRKATYSVAFLGCGMNSEEKLIP